MFVSKVIRTRVISMTQELIERSRKRQAFVDIGLVVTTATLVLSLVVAFTVVSIGIARADTLAPFGDLGSGRLILTGVVGFVIASIGGLIAAMVHDDPSSARRG